MTQPHGTYAAGMMSLERGTNITDSGAPFYDVYECADGKWIALGAVEKKFYAEALRVLGLEALLAAYEAWKTIYADLGDGFGAGRPQRDWDPLEKEMLGVIELEKLLAIERTTVEK